MAVYAIPLDAGKVTFIGLNTDTKPTLATPGQSVPPVIGSKFIEYNTTTGAVATYITYDGTNWVNMNVVAILAGTAVIGKVGHDITGIAGGRKVVTTAGTRVALAASTTAKLVIITAETDNTNPVTVGGADVVGALATRVGTPLYAGESIILPCDNLADIYIDSITNGEGVTFTYLT